MIEETVFLKEHTGLIGWGAIIPYPKEVENNEK